MKKDKTQLAVKVKEHTLLANKLRAEVVTDKVILLTDEKAAEFLEMETFSGERQVSQKHVQYLYDQYSTGRFLWEQAHIAVAIMGGKKYRINGQHTCWMRMNISDKIEPKVKETVYKVPDEENLRALYCSFDRNKARSSGHSLKALLVGHSCATDLWASTLGKLALGLRMWRFGDNEQATKMSPEDLATLVTEQYPQLFRTTGILFQEMFDTFPAVQRMGVIAALFATAQVQPNKVNDFWMPLASGLGLNEKTDARYVLRRWLDETARSSSHDGGVSPEETYRVCINAWNKWRKGTPVTMLKTTDERLNPV